MKSCCAAVVFVIAIMSGSCSERSTQDQDKDAKPSESPRDLVRESEAETEEREGELQPPEDKIGEDCVAFVRSTKVVPARAASADCPTCPAGGTDVFSFRQMKTDAVSCSGDTCKVVVTMRAVFNAASGESLAGGLTAWIPPEQRSAILRGEAPAGEQVYRAQITYRRRGDAWRAIEFERAAPE